MPILLIIFSLLIVVVLPQKTWSSDYCKDFPTKLSKCEKYECTLGPIMKKNILGLVRDRCHYQETAPGIGQADCLFTPEYRKAISEFMKDMLQAGPNANTGKKYKIGSQEVANPFQEAFNKGQCKQMK